MVLFLTKIGLARYVFQTSPKPLFYMALQKFVVFYYTPLSSLTRGKTRDSIKETLSGCLVIESPIKR